MAFANKPQMKVFYLNDFNNIMQLSWNPHSGWRNRPVPIKYESDEIETFWRSDLSAFALSEAGGSLQVNLYYQDIDGYVQEYQLKGLLISHLMSHVNKVTDDQRWYPAHKFITPATFATNITSYCHRDQIDNKPRLCLT
jgi:hypothetical protein